MAKRSKTRPDAKAADIPTPAAPEALNQRGTPIPKPSRKSRSQSKRTARVWNPWISILAQG